MAKLGFVGAGTTGTALAMSLHSKGYDIVSVASRSKSSANALADAVGCRAYEDKQSVADTADLIFLTTPDSSIQQVAGEINWHVGQSVVHCSGAHSVDILQKAKDDGACVGAFHPLQTFASVTHAIESLPGSTFALEAEGVLLDELKGMAEALEGSWVVLGPGDKVLYHAAAVIACNYMVTLASIAGKLWQNFGSSPQEAVKSLLPLIRGTVNNLENVGLPNCLTGPIARGDLETIQRHLDALEERAPSIASTYRDLGLKTVPIALAKGKIDEERAEDLRRLLAGRENNPKEEC